MSRATSPEAKAVRPSLTPLFLGSVAAWGAALALEMIFWRRFVGEGLEAGAAALVVILILSLLAALKSCHGRRGIVAVLSIALCVAACSGLYWFAWEANVKLVSEAAKDGSPLVVDLVSDPSERDYGYVSEAEMHLDSSLVRLRVMWPQGSDRLDAGHRIVAKGTFNVPENDDGGRWNHQQGFAGMLSISSYEEQGFCGGLRGLVTPLRDASLEHIEALGGNASGLLAGILLGNKTLYAGTEVEQDFRVTGLAHLMAVSGTHLAVVTALVFWVLRSLPVNRRARTGILAVLLAGYVALTAFSPSAMRACAMCLAGMAASGFGRRKHILSALSACVFLFLALEPRLAFSLGFQLSVLCMVGLVVFSPLACAWVECLLPKRSSQLAQGLAATFCASLVTMPVTIPLFCQLPLISPLSTLLASPLITAALALGLCGLLASAGNSFLGSLLLKLAGTVSELCAWVVHQLARLPFACVPLDASAPWLGALGVSALIALWVVWPLPDEGERKGRAALQALSAFAIPAAVVLVIEFGGSSALIRVSGAAVESDAQVIMLDVGQGDAMVVRDGSSAVLVDTGEEGTVLLKALARNGLGRLDAVALSHKDIDHTGALASLAGVVEVGHVLVHRDLVGEEVLSVVEESARRVTSGAGVEGVGVGTTVGVGRFTLELVSPEQGGQSENEDSLIWLLTFDEDGDGIAEAKGLLTGDGEQEAIEGVVSSIGDISFLKVAHHGSRDAVSADELEVLKPELSLISVGEDNDYGHPTKSTLEVLEQARSTVYRTDLAGDIILSFQGDKIGVRTQRGQ